MTDTEIVAGKTYRGKNFVGINAGPNNDLTILWRNRYQVQYDSDTVPRGRRFPKIKIDKFLQWAKRELTAEELKEYRQ